MASKCYYREAFQQETMDYLFLTTPTAHVWKYFANCARIKVNATHLQQLINLWWQFNRPRKLRAVFRIVLVVILWELWKRRNSRRHDLDISLKKLIY